MAATSPLLWQLFFYFSIFILRVKCRARSPERENHHFLHLFAVIYRLCWACLGFFCRHWASKSAGHWDLHQAAAQLSGKSYKTKQLTPASVSHSTIRLQLLMNRMMTQGVSCHFRVFRKDSAGFSRFHTRLLNINTEFTQILMNVKSWKSQDCLPSASVSHLCQFLPTPTDMTWISRRRTELSGWTLKKRRRNIYFKSSYSTLGQRSATIIYWIF